MGYPQKIAQKLRQIASDRGLMFTVGLSLLLLFFFYGKLLINPATTYFGSSNDGMQVYYQTIYHTRYDPEFWRQQSINYPFGESIFFTSAMPMVNNIVKLFGPSAAQSGVAVINLLMLFSIPAGAIFIYLIFRRLNLPWLYGSVCAVAIAFFSPQVARMGGHYSLSWIFLIPAMVYLLIKFYEAPTMKKSLSIALLSLLAATTHLYFFAFFGAMIGMYWLYLIVSRDEKSGGIFSALKHFSLQVIVPFVLLQLLVMYSSDVSDRTSFPGGYLVYKSNMTGVFFPVGQFYQPLFDKIALAEQIESEGMSYVGLAAVIGFIVIIFVQLSQLFRFRIRSFFTVTESKPLNIVFWTSIILLFISFGHPFKGGNEEWLLHIGSFRQFRAIGRFAWVFYYAVNIVVVYKLYKLGEQKKYLRYAVMVLVPVILCTDMLNATIRMSLGTKMNNRIEVLDDEMNQLPANQWLKEFEPNTYQAILPLPYFHIGSENLLRIPSDLEIVNQSYIVSLKTGLPIMAVSSSRTSLSQTNQLVSLVLEHSSPLPVLEKLPDQRPLLLVVRAETLDESERRLLALAQPIATSEKYAVYSLEPAAISAMIAHQYDVVKTEMSAAKLFSNTMNPCMSSDSLRIPVYVSFDELKGSPFKGSGAFTGNFRKPVVICDTTFPDKAGNYNLTLWVNKIDQDVFPRTVLHITMWDQEHADPIHTQITNVSLSTRMIAGSWALVEVPFTIPGDSTRLQISMWNDDLRPDDTNEVDELLILPEGLTAYQVCGDTIYRNNRQYFPHQ